MHHLLPLLALALVAIPSARAADLPDLIRAYEADLQSIRSFHDLNWSDECQTRYMQGLDDWRTRLNAIPEESLKTDDTIDWTLLRIDLDREAGQIRSQRERLSALDGCVPFRGVVARLESSRWRGESMDPSAAALEVDAIRSTVTNLRARIEAGRKKDPAPDTATNAIVLTPPQALRAARLVEEIRNALKRWFEFHHGYQPTFSWWVETAHQETAKALEDYAKYLREEIAGIKGKDDDPLIGTPIGRDAVMRELALEFIAYTPEELIARAERELADCRAEWTKAAEAMGCGSDWKAALEKVKASYVAPGEQDELVGQIARESIAFVRAHAFVTIPPICEETWRMRMIAPETLKTIPYAAYSGQEMMVAYARDDMSAADKRMVMRGNNRHATRVTVPHELIPGHHLQGFVAARERAYRRSFATPFLVEGWALYCEIRFWELGWPTTPEDRIGMLFWRAHRAARIITTLKFHLGSMTPDEMVDFLVNEVGHERFGARSEVRRFIDDATPPLYQVAYLTGGLQLRALQAERVKPGDLTEQAFNDAVLRENGIPVELIRSALRNERVPRDAKPVWRF